MGVLQETCAKEQPSAVCGAFTIGIIAKLFDYGNWNLKEDTEKDKVILKKQV